MRSRISGVMRTIVGQIGERAPTNGSSRLGKLFDRHGADVLGVQPHGLGIEGIVFGEIDHRVAAIDAFERERVDQAPGGVICSRSFLGDQPSRQRKLTNACRQKAGVAIGGHADHRAVAALGKLGAVGRDQQRQVRELRAA